MSKPLILLNALLLGASALAAIYVVRTVIARPPRATAAVAQTSPAANVASQKPAEPQGPATASYAVVAARNLFSPTRTEAPGPGTPAQQALQFPKPNLFGVVLKDGGAIAYLEDPSTKRVAAYRVGDAIAGGTVQAIQPDQVLLARADGQVAVKLHDPTRPRPTPVATPGQPGANPLVGQPQPFIGQTPPQFPSLMPTQPAPQPLVGLGAPGHMQAIQGRDPAEQPGIPSRRPLPPNLLRRVPPSPTADAPSR